MKRLAIPFALLALVVFADPAMSTQSPDSPTYDETRDWIVSKLKLVGGITDYAAYGGLVSIRYESVSMENCELRYTIVGTRTITEKKKRERSTWISDVRIELNKVQTRNSSEQSDTIVIGQGEDSKSPIVFTTTKQGIHVRGPTWSDDKERLAWQEKTGTGFDILDTPNFYSLLLRQPGIDPGEMRMRMLTALNHAIGLCRNLKPEVKEPF